MQVPASEERKRRFELLALPHLDAAYQFARWLAGTDADAEDVVQEACLRAYRYFETWQGNNFRVWLFTIVRHSFLGWVRNNRDKRLAFGLDQAGEPSGTIETAWAEPPADPETLLLRQQISAALERLLQGMPQAFREVLVLRELEGLSYREIARITGAPVGTVMSRLARARSLLRDCWRRSGNGEELP